MSGHGYREAARHLAGEWSLERAIEVTARRTRQYAKRQLTWFRRDPRVEWLPVGDREADAPDLVEVARRRAAQLGTGQPDRLTPGRDAQGLELGQRQRVLDGTRAAEVVALTGR